MLPCGQVRLDPVRGFKPPAKKISTAWTSNGVDKFARKNIMGKCIIKSEARDLESETLFRISKFEIRILANKMEDDFLNIINNNDDDFEDTPEEAEEEEELDEEDEENDADEEEDDEEEPIETE